MDITYECDFENSGFGTADIEQILPQWKTKVVEIHHFRDNRMEIRFFIAATTIEELMDWLKAFERKSKCTYSIRSSEKCTGRKVLFKQRLNCHHNTQSKTIYDPSKRNRTKNTNCPSYLVMTLHAKRKKYLGKNQILASNVEMQGEIRLMPTHNHDINSAETLRFRKVSPDVQGKLKKLFESGHSPSTALESLKIDILLNNKDSEVLLSDRNYFPDYMYCYHLFAKEFANKGEPIILSKKKVQDKLKTFNEINNDGTTMIDSVSVGDEVNMDEEEDMTEGETLLQEIFFKLSDFLTKSPNEVTSSLRNFKKGLDKITTPSAFTSCCIIFAKGKNIGKAENLHDAKQMFIDKNIENNDHQASVYSENMEVNCILMDQECTSKHSDSYENLSKCDVYNKEFIRTSNLETHKITHTGDKSYKCDMCNKRFRTSSALTTHKLVHKSANPYQCVLCNKGFTQQSNLARHILIHTGEKPYQCDVCDKRFTQSSHLTKHFLIHTGEKPYKCDICNKCFRSLTNLASHKQIHKSENLYSCDMCYKWFQQSSDLVTHKLTHTDEEFFKCEICDKIFTESIYLMNHKLTHTDENPISILMSCVEQEF